MFGIGLPEMILILALALIVVGPDKLPDLARSIAKGVMELKKTAEGLKDQLQEDGNPLDDIKPDLEDAAKAFKSHMLEHPDKGKTDLFPTEGVNPSTDNATKAYEELTKAGIDPTKIPTDNTGGPPSIDLSSDDLTEVVEPVHPTTDTPEPEGASGAKDNSTSDTDNKQDK